MFSEGVIPHRRLRFWQSFIENETTNLKLLCFAEHLRNVYRRSYSTSTPKLLSKFYRQWNNKSETTLLRCVLIHALTNSFISITNDSPRDRVNDLLVLRSRQADRRKLKLANSKSYQEVRTYSPEYLHVRSMHIPKMCSPDLPKKVDPL